MNESFLEIAESRASFLQEIYDKIVKNPYSSQTDLSKKFVLILSMKKHQTSEKYLNRYLGILVSTDIKDYETNSLRMKEDYE